MAPKFGTSGLRGLVTELTDDLCARYTAAFLATTAHDGVLLVGGDLRPSTPRIAAAVTAGAAHVGVRVIDCGALPTPALALDSQRRGAPAIMITGSHIPADRNGLKFYTARGEITKSNEIAIARALTETPEIRFSAETEPEIDPAAGDAARAAYVARYTDWAAPDALTGLRIGVYEHSAVGRDLLTGILRALGADTVPLGRSDMFIPVDTEAVDAPTRALLAGWAQEHGLDSIVSTDGDSDRPLLTDEAGQVIPGDILGPLTARHLGATAVITPVSSNSMIEAMGAFDPVVRTRIGSPFVIAGMETTGGAVVGYEANGGFLLGFMAQGPHGPMAPLMTRDCLLPILAPLILAATTRQPLSALLCDLPARRTASDRLGGVPTAASQALVADLTKNAAARHAFLGQFGPEQNLDLTDGLRVTFANGDIIHLRPSGNAPELRCYTEAADAPHAKALLASTLSMLATRLT